MNMVQKILLVVGIVALVTVYFTSPKYYTVQRKGFELKVKVTPDTSDNVRQYIDSTALGGRALIVVGLTAVIIVFSKPRK